MLTLLLIILLIAWAGGYWGYPATRGNNLVHLVLVIFVIVLVIEFLGGGRHLFRW